MNIFKSKWRYQGKMSPVEYLDACSSLVAWFGGITRGGFVNDPPLTSPEAFRWVREAVDSTGLDFSDAYQIYSVKNGYFKHASGESKTVLATTDKLLAEVARKYNLLAIDLTTDSEPR